MLYRYNTGLGLLLLRVGLAVIFIGHGSQKLFGAFGGDGVSGTAVLFESLGVPLPQVMAVVVGIIELGGGILIAVGLLTQVAALLIAIVMLTALMIFHLPQGFFVSPQAFGYEFVMMNMFAALTLVFAGPGRLSMDEGISRTAADPAPAHTP
jgi:putative oxidoreductase